MAAFLVFEHYSYLLCAEIDVLLLVRWMPCVTLVNTFCDDASFLTPSFWVHMFTWVSWNVDREYTFSAYFDLNKFLKLQQHQISGKS